MENDKSSIYMDFKNNPTLIRHSLEDFLPFNKWAFVESFYSLIEWINSPLSSLESNDCNFNIAQDNNDHQYPYAKKCSIRLMILFRDIPENCQERSIEWLTQNILQSVATTKLSYKSGAVCISLNDTCYLELGDKPDTGGLGQQIVLTFFSYGKNNKRCYESMQQVINHAHNCIKKVDKQIKNGELDAIYC